MVERISPGGCSPSLSVEPGPVQPQLQSPLSFRGVLAMIQLQSTEVQCTKTPRSASWTIRPHGRALSYTPAVPSVPAPLPGGPGGWDPGNAVVLGPAGSPPHSASPQGDCVG